ncbi:inositol phospholipid synthesis protein Scs3p [Ceratobasidium sp. AG-Ba]|nr:inositol phospholipid synthesis protein Scs3p [Ceratobasidium sp. AG-Ba]
MPQRTPSERRRASTPSSQPPESEFSTLSTSSIPLSRPANSPLLLHRLLVLALLTALILGGTLYSAINNTSLDTSDPILAHLPHPAAKDSYFARKSNIFNQLFVKKAWGWTSAAFFALWLSGPSHLRKGGRVAEWAIATGIWLLFTMWFFGPSIFERFVALTGGQCVVLLPPSPDAKSNIVTVPTEFCEFRKPVSPITHPALFASELLTSRLSSTHSLDPKWHTVPKFYSGHDISGHIFLLTMSIFFLAEQISLSLPLVYPQLDPVPGTVQQHGSDLHRIVVKASMVLLSIWFLMSWATAMYFHTAFEKISGFLVGLLAAYLIKLPIPVLSRAPPPAPRVVPLEKPEI